MEWRGAEMTFQRDLAWQELELLHQSSIAHQFARYALRLNYGLLPPDVAHQAKRSLLDTLGCAIGGYQAPGRSICEEVANAMGGPEEATLIGSGRRTSAMNATLVNSFMVRFLDYNDHGGGGHNSDSIPAILAVAEREKSGGADFLTSLVVSYELGARVKDSFTGKALSKKGFVADLRGGLTMPAALGRLMGLNEDQIANAIGSCGCGNISLQILDADREEFSMRKNLRFGAISYAAILYCMLAKKGFTGPVRIVEGDGGWREGFAQGEMDLDTLGDMSGWRILKVWHKSVPMNGTTSGHVLATLGIVKEHDLKPEDIAAVRIRCSRREAAHTTTLAKKYPRNAESADHSAFYLNAIAIKERDCGPDSIIPEKFTDPVVLDLIEKITVEADDDPRFSHNEGTSEITTKDGRKFQKHVVWPHGYGASRMTDTEIEDKFRDMASRYMGERQIKQIIDTAWNAEKLDSMSDLMRMMVF
jgi:2-methylcitrate dehydratase